ncbi:MAG: hypothetical protein CMM02_09770 [Rhodopirellula sp.]|nr:hypothetical protein [Rhodopirellula sp.]|tara:strand:- start:5424 stop:5750 length:327 start_codon:yes stop_codon:yes gene_type:complete
MPPQISLDSLYQYKNNKDKKKTYIFDEIILKCHDKIKKIAIQGGQCIFFEIPYVIIGKPLYNIFDCIDYIVKALKKNGLFVSILAPPNNNILYISWNPNDTNKRKRLT